MSEDYLPVPVEVARQIADQFHKSVVIIFCVDPAHDLLHATTYGSDPRDKAWSAQGAEIAAQALGSPNKRTSFEDYRLDQAQKLLSALRDAVALMEDRFFATEDHPCEQFDIFHRVIADAEKFLEAPKP